MKIHLLNSVAVDLQNYCILSCILESQCVCVHVCAGFKQAQLKDVHFYCEAFLEHTVVLTFTY